MGEEAEKEVLQYIETVREPNIAGENIGAIVMNCNPMTMGYLFLIEEALKQVDFLYVFVVEEDRSEILFEDRFKMVKAAAGKYENIKIIPSGKFVLSYVTMPVYFEKAKRQEEVLDASQDLEIFCDRIAPGLNITVRFVGEEPNDKITKQYNEVMKRLLPRYYMKLVEIPGNEVMKRLLPRYYMKLVEIPGLEHERNIISASIVRKYIKEDNLEEIQRLMPKEAYEILINRKEI